MSAKPIVTIIGPTAVGKTALALDLARELDGELVGTDSMQAVRGMNIGTAKPTPQELGQIRHHMLDVWSVAHRADVVQFRGLAREAITGITTRKRITSVVGGSVLSVKAIWTNSISLPPIPRSVGDMRPCWTKTVQKNCMNCWRKKTR